MYMAIKSVADLPNGILQSQGSRTFPSRTVDESFIDMVVYLTVLKKPSVRC